MEGKGGGDIIKEDRIMTPAVFTRICARRTLHALAKKRNSIIQVLNLT